MEDDPFMSTTVINISNSVRITTPTPELPTSPPLRPSVLRPKGPAPPVVVIGCHVSLLRSILTLSSAFYENPSHPDATLDPQNAAQ